jgi:fibronectin-binding autotransporter adhesin
MMIVQSGETASVSAGGTAIDTTVANGGTLDVSSGGTASNTIIDSGGQENGVYAAGCSGQRRTFAGHVDAHGRRLGAAG